MNKFHISGEVISEPELQHGEHTAYCSTVVLVEYVGSDGKDHTSVLPIKAFGDQAERLATIRMGGIAGVKGTLERNRPPGQAKYPPVTLVATSVSDRTKTTTTS